jgi:hypothetical protein
MSTIPASTSWSASSQSAANAFASSGRATTSSLKRSGTNRIDHPLVGPLELSYEKLPIPDTDRQILVAYHAAPDSPSAQALTLLATTATGEREPIGSLLAE